jgi:hypothetical protein
MTLSLLLFTPVNVCLFWYHVDGQYVLLLIAGELGTPSMVLCCFSYVEICTFCCFEFASNAPLLSYWYSHHTLGLTLDCLACKSLECLLYFITRVVGILFAPIWRSVHLSVLDLNWCLQTFTNFLISDILLVLIRFIPFVMICLFVSPVWVDLHFYWVRFYVPSIFISLVSFFFFHYILLLWDDEGLWTYLRYISK